MLNWLRFVLKGNDGAQIPKHERRLDAAIGYLIRQFLVIMFESHTLTIKSQKVLWGRFYPVSEAGGIRGSDCIDASQERGMPWLRYNPGKCGSGMTNLGCGGNTK